MIHAALFLQYATFNVQESAAQQLGLNEEDIMFKYSYSNTISLFAIAMIGRELHKCVKLDSFLLSVQLERIADIAAANWTSAKTELLSRLPRQCHLCVLRPAREERACEEEAGRLETQEDDDESGKK